MTSLLPGLVGRRVATDRLTTAYLEIEGRETGAPVVFVHGNVSSSLFWQETMLSLPPAYRPLALDLRGFGDTDPLPVDATRGLSDYADDLASFVTALGLPSAHIVGWSMGGGVALQYLVDRPVSVASLTLVNPVSPYGFGGTHGLAGVRNDASGAGCGGGGANAEFVRRLAEGDRSDESPVSPRNVMLQHYVKPPYEPKLADVFVQSMLSTRTGDDHYPGTSTTIETWPGFAPGTRGVLNTMAPQHFRIAAATLSSIPVKPPILWIRGAEDPIVSDTSLYDFAYLGSLGAIPGWPGPEVCPPQPMVSQTRAVLDAYAESGGSYEEVVVADSGHSPHLDQAAAFDEALHAHLARL